MPGSNVIAIPIMVTTAYPATREQELGGEHKDQERHRREHLVPVEPGAVKVQALPCLGVIALSALPTLPAPWWAPPIDGWILLLACLACAAQALLPGRAEGEEAEWKKRGQLKAMLPGDDRRPSERSGKFPPKSESRSKGIQPTIEGTYWLP